MFKPKLFNITFELKTFSPISKAKHLNFARGFFSFSVTSSLLLPKICLACFKAKIELNLFCCSRNILKLFDKRRDERGVCGSVNYLTFHCLRL